MTSQKSLTVAVRAAIEAGQILMKHYGKLQSRQIQIKSKNDFVTVVDKASEAKVIQTIKNAFPKDGFLAEESGASEAAQRVWVIDPLDGTANYIHSFPQFSVSIALYENKKPVLGVVYDPLHNELFTAIRGCGAYLNKKRIFVSQTRKLADAFMTTGIPFRARKRYLEYLRCFERISLGSCGLRRGGSAALDLSYVACGRFDGFWELDLSPWDIAAGAILIQEAGGQVTDLWGDSFFMKSGDILASNKQIHRELCKITDYEVTPVKVSKF